MNVSLAYYQTGGYPGKASNAMSGPAPRVAPAIDDNGERVPHGEIFAGRASTLGGLLLF
jgi:hypothetical protein